MEVITDTDVAEEAKNSNDSNEMLQSECYASPQISLNVIAGTPTFNIMGMKVVVAKPLLHLLMDTGSTYNFLDLFTAKKLGCKMTKTYPLQEEFANVFALPTELPPKRSRDHIIPLKDEATMVNIILYTYPPGNRYCTKGQNKDKTRHEIRKSTENRS
ncbi:hypothetical protein Tco_1320662 [Tanacetum coccineum]